MFSTNIVNVPQPGAMPAAGAGREAETAGFDFTNYLLGLQTSSTQETGEALTNGESNPLASLKGALLPDSGAEAAKTSKKENSPWNLIFPGIGAATLPPVGPVPGKTADTVSEPGPMSAISGAHSSPGKVVISAAEAKLLERVGLVPDAQSLEKAGLVLQSQVAGSGSQGVGLAGQATGSESQAVQTRLTTHGPVVLSATGEVLKPGEQEKISGLETASGSKTELTAEQKAELTPEEKLQQKAELKKDPLFGPHGAKVQTSHSGAGQPGEPFVGSLTELKQRQITLPSDGDPSSATKEIAMQRYAQVHSRFAESSAASQPNSGIRMSSGDAEPEGAGGVPTERKHAADDLATSDGKITGGGATPTALSTLSGRAAAEPTSPAPPSSVPHLFTRVESLVHQGGGKMTVSLTPPELGKVEVEVTMRGKRVELRMTSESEASKSVLQSGLGDLKRSLEGQNLQLTHADVQIARDGHSHGQFANNPQSGGSFLAQQQPQQEGRSGSQGWNNAPRVARSMESRVEQVVSRPRAVAPGRVDVRI